MVDEEILELRRKLNESIKREGLYIYIYPKPRIRWINNKIL